MESQIGISVLTFIPEGYSYTHKFIENILGQDFGDIEFFIISEESDDTTKKIIESYSDRRIIHMTNKVKSGNQKYQSFNTVFQAITGKYVLFLDIRNNLESYSLRELWYFLEEHPNALAACSDYICRPSNINYSLPHSHKEFKLALLKNEDYSHSIVLIRTNVFKILNGFNEQYLIYSEYDFLCRLVLIGEVACLPKVLSCYDPNKWPNQEKKQEEYTEIQRNYQLNFINAHLSTGQALITKNEISSLNIGLIIAYYTYAKYYKEDLYNQLANRLLDGVVSNLSTTLPITLQDGLLGVACGIIYLIRNNFIEGDEDEILSEIDHVLYRNLIDLEEESKIDWFSWIYYSRQRLSFGKILRRGLTGIRYQQHFIYMLDCLLRSIQKNIVLPNEVIPEIQWIHSQKICPVITQKILDLIDKKYQPGDINIQPIKNKKVAFIIPLRVDSEERARNLDFLLDKLSSFENTEIWILEADKYPHYFLKRKYTNLHYIFQVDYDPIFYRTKYLNLLLSKTSCNIVGIWDVDVFVPERQIKDTIEKIASGKVVMGFPYDGQFFMLSPEKTDMFIKTESLDNLMSDLNKQYLIHGSHSVGGAFLVNRDIYLRAGGENENFYGWGLEDLERVKRMEILGLPIYRAKGALFHLFHPRKENSWFANKNVELKNRLEFLKVCGKTKEELLEYVQTWKVQVNDILNNHVLGKKRKIFFCIDSLGCGGAERLLIDILRRLDYNRFEVSLFVLSDIGEYITDIPKQVRWCTFSSVGHFKELLNDIYDVEIAFLEGLAVKYIVERDSNAVKIAWIHTNLERFNWPLLFYNTKEEEYKCFAKMDKLVFVSNNSLNGFKRLFPSVDSENVVIHNLIDTLSITKKSLKIKVAKTKFTICCIGRLTKVKGYELLLGAASRLLKDNFDFQIWIFGEGELRETLKRQIQILNISENVILKGFIKKPYPYLAQADLFVSSSLVEGASLAICEALCLGIPILATRSGGAEEMLKQGEYGMLIPIEENSIYEAVKSILETPKLYEDLKQKAWSGRNCFDVNRTMDIITTLLQSL